MPDQIVAAVVTQTQAVAVQVITQPQAVAVQVNLGVKGDKGLIGDNGVDEVSPTPPLDPLEGDRWFNSVTGLSYTYYDGVWVSNSAGAAYVPHASRHAADGDDPITPGSIGAAATNHSHAGVYQPVDANLVSVATPADGDMIQRVGGSWVTRTIAQIKTALGLGSAAYTASTDYAAASHAHAGVYDPAGTASAAVSGHVSATDPHGDRAYAEGLVMGLLDDRGNFDASINTFPTTGGSGPAGAILKGDLWTISVVATSGPLVGYNVSCVLRALVDAPGQTVGNWAVNAVGYGYSPENAGNKSSSVETDQASTSKYPSVKALYDWATGRFATSASLSGYVPTIRAVNSHPLSSDITLSADDVGGLAAASNLADVESVPIAVRNLKLHTTRALNILGL